MMIKIHDGDYMYGSIIDSYSRSNRLIVLLKLNLLATR